MSTFVRYPCNPSFPKFSILTLFLGFLETGGQVGSPWIQHCGGARSSQFRSQKSSQTRR